jgi:hypothetical protein
MIKQMQFTFSVDTPPGNIGSHHHFISFTFNLIRYVVANIDGSGFYGDLLCQQNQQAKRYLLLPATSLSLLSRSSY